MSRVHVAVAALSVLSSLAYPAPFASASTLPTLSGAYIFTGHRVCQVAVTVDYANIKGVNNTSFAYEVTGAPAANTVGVTAGSFSFTQKAGAAGTGTVFVSETNVSGSPIFITSSAPGGVFFDGSAIKSQLQASVGPFKQTATTLSVNGSPNYNIYYGKVTNGIVQTATVAGVDSSGCAEELTITHN